MPSPEVLCVGMDEDSARGGSSAFTEEFILELLLLEEVTRSYRPE